MDHTSAIYSDAEDDIGLPNDTLRQPSVHPPDSARYADPSSTRIGGPNLFDLETKRVPYRQYISWSALKSSSQADCDLCSTFVCASAASPFSAVPSYCDLDAEGGWLYGSRSAFVDDVLRLLLLYPCAKDELGLKHGEHGDSERLFWVSEFIMSRAAYQGQSAIRNPFECGIRADHHHDSRSRGLSIT